MPSNKNINLVEKVRDQLKSSSGFIALNYKGLTHKQIELLRDKLSGVGGNFHIIKNTLFKIGLTQSNLYPEEKIKSFLSHLTGPTAILFIKENYVTPIKTLAEFFKQHDLPTIKGGIVDADYLSNEKILEISKLPSLKELIEELIGKLQKPTYALVYLLSDPTRHLVYTLSIYQSKERG